ncbi:MAG: CoB--CoM heterodisulfide reductase iron-sulfur subunit B family protein [Anaerolineae bacterium]|nr:CoB--CoM heterodisulfide reductase iron-sulfur subunit B family protein [Anaerolineae bacterium]
MQTLALFPGCLVLQRMPQYEKASSKVLEEIDIHLENIAHASCCGAPLESFTDRWLYLATYNLALAERMGRDMVTLCGNCANTLSRARASMDDPDLRAQVNEALDKLGLRYGGGVEVKHLVRLLVEHLDELRQKVTRPLSLRVAVTHPCQAIRPSEVMGFDNPFQPEAMRRIVEMTGAEVVDYQAEHDCCGATLYLADERLGLDAGRSKLASAAAADVLVGACGNCQLLLERFQGLLVQDGATGRLPVLTLPQLLGLAMGIDADDLGIGPAKARQLVGSLA